MEERIVPEIKSDTTEKKPVYLDNTATTFPKPECVYKAADIFYRKFGGNAGRGGSPFSLAGSDLLEETRLMVAEWLDVDHPDKVIFVPSATIAMNIVLQGVAITHGSNIYATPFEHNAVLRPLEHLRKTKGATVTEIPFDKNSYMCKFDLLEELFRNQPPALVCLTQASNVCGLMPPIIAIAQMAKKYNPNALVIVDGAQGAGLFPLPMQDGLMDALIFAGHKSMYAPYGAAGFVLTGKWQPEHLIYGGTGTKSDTVVMPYDLPVSYEAGSRNIWSIAGLNASLKWLKEKGREQIVSRTVESAFKIVDELSMIPEVNLMIPPKNMPFWNTISFTVKNATPQEIEAALGKKNITTRAGIHCAPGAHRFLNTLPSGGTVRVSTSSFTTQEEIQYFIRELKNIVFKKTSGTKQNESVNACSC